MSEEVIAISAIEKVLNGLLKAGLLGWYDMVEVKYVGDKEQWVGIDEDGDSYDLPMEEVMDAYRRAMEWVESMNSCGNSEAEEKAKEGEVKTPPYEGFYYCIIEITAGTKTPYEFADKLLWMDGRWWKFKKCDGNYHNRCLTDLYKVKKWRFLEEDIFFGQYKEPHLVR